MSNLKAEVVVEFGGDDRLFRLTLPGILELEETCGAPFAVIAGRVAAGQYGVNDVLHPIRLGLIGGGMKPEQASKLMRGYAFPAQPIAEGWHVARAVLMAALVGFQQAPLDDAGKT